jgi:hypothetical protein
MCNSTTANVTLTKPENPGGLSIRHCDPGGAPAGAWAASPRRARADRQPPGDVRRAGGEDDDEGTDAPRGDRGPFEQVRHAI